MRVLLLGADGYVGRHVKGVLQMRGHEVIGEKDYGSALVIHCGWMGIPDYEDVAQYDNIHKIVSQVKALVERGAKSWTMLGTGLETVAPEIPYSRAKRYVKEECLKIVSTGHPNDGSFRWVRLFNIYGGNNEPKERLVPQLLAAAAKGKSNFPCVNAARDFMKVEIAAAHIVRIALQNEVLGDIDCCTGVQTQIKEHCEYLLDGFPMEFIEMPARGYEPVSYGGNPAQLLSVK